MKKLLSHTVIFFLSLMLLVVPVISFANVQGEGGWLLFTIVPCGEDDPDTCNLNQLVELIRRIINVLFAVSIPLSLIAFTWVGILLLTAKGNVGRIRQAKEIALKVLIGFIFILAAWLIVYTITSALLKPEFNQFLEQGR